MQGHHNHNYKYAIGEKLEYQRESENEHSEHVISVYSKKTNLGMKIIRQISDALAKVVDGLMSGWKAIQVIIKTDTKHRIAPEETWVSGGEIKFPCIHILYEAKVHKSHVLQKIKQYERGLIF